MQSSASFAGRAASRIGSGWQAPLFLCLAAGLLYTVNLDRLPNPDELHHALAARGLLEDGTPRIAEGIYERGLLYTWMVAGSYALFGDSLFVARLPAVACMALLVGALFCWIRREAGPLAAWIGAGLFAVSPFAVDMAQFSRFYAPQCLTFFVGAVLVHEAVLTTDGLRRRLLLGALALPPLLLAVYFQPTTLMGLVGVGLWGAGALAIPWLADPAVPRRRKLLTLGGVLLAGTIAAAAALATGIPQDFWRQYRWSPLFNQGLEDRFWFYHAWYSLLYPSLWPATGLLALVALAARPRAGSFALVVFAVAFLLNSLGAAKNLRYLVYAQVFLFVLWGIALAQLWPLLQGFGRDLRSALAKALDRLAPGLGRLGTVLLAGGVLVLLATNPFWLRTASFLGDFSIPPEQPPPNWPMVHDRLMPLVTQADVVVTTEELATLYFLGRYDVRFSPSKMNELPEEEQHEFGRDHRTGRPVITNEQSLLRIFACYPKGVILGPTASWNNPILISEHLADLIRANAEPVALPPASRIFAYAWDNPPSVPRRPECAGLPRFPAGESAS